MFGKLLSDVVDAAANVATVVTAPVAVVANVAAEATKPIAEAAKDVVEAVVDQDPQKPR
jgi:hypothetical protein